MTPAAIAEFLGITLEAMEKGAPFGQTFRALGRASSGFVDFYNRLRKEADLMGRFSASEAYRLAQFWTREDIYLHMLDPGTVIPPAFTSRLARAPRFDLGENAYRYDVKVWVYFPGGTKKDFGMPIDSPVPLSLAEVRRQALEHVARDIFRDTLPAGAGEDFFEVATDVTVYGAHRVIA